MTDRRPPPDREPPDQNARDRVRTGLDRSMLIEAGAGSGKTTAMVGRMVELIASGTATVDQIAAVTFTRKAGGELRERFQEAMERGASAADADPTRSERLLDALESGTSGFIGTIHSFCTEILRDRALQAGIPPGFRVVMDRQERELWDEAWDAFLEALYRDEGEGALLVQLRDVGLDPRDLRAAAEEVVRNPEAHYPAPEHPAPSAERIAALRSAVESLLDRTLAILPADMPAGGWDALQKRILGAEYARSMGEWEVLSGFLESVGRLSNGSIGVTKNRWGGREAADAAKALESEWDALRADGGEAMGVLADWYAHRYPTVVRFASRAEAFYREHRLSQGALTQHDLLTYTLRLFVRSPEVRRRVGERFRFVLVDEFQDTDPLQTEILFRLTSDGETEAGWQSLVPRPGALFVVGDPKQSIYRFRRADISLYRRVRDRFAEWGEVHALTANFRSDGAFESFVERVFGDRFPERATETQAPFAPLRTLPERAEGRIASYTVEVTDRRSASGVSDPDRRALATWIAERVASGERRPGDFMILTHRKAPLGAYGEALEALRIPVEVSGSEFDARSDVEELILLLEALRDPLDPVTTVAVLEGPFFGLTGQELWEHIESGERFDTWSGSPDESAVGQALHRMREWRGILRRWPVDVAVRQIVEDLALIPFLGAGGRGSTPLGSLRVGLDELRTRLSGRAATVSDAIAALEDIVELEVETPLHPNDPGVVRIMNVHQAKGLQAPVVILAYPRPERAGRVRTAHHRRSEDGGAEGFFEARHPFTRAPLARPLAWPGLRRREEEFEAAERDRLLYVAATRAENELVVARSDHRPDSSPWALLHEALDASDIGMDVSRSDGEEEVGSPIEPLVDPTPVAERVAEARARWEASAEPTYARRAPSEHDARERHDDTGEGGAVVTVSAPYDRVGGTGSRSSELGGLEWGDRVHRALLVLGALERSEGEDAMVRALDSVDVEDEDRSALERELERVCATQEWQAAQASSVVRREVAFSAWEAGDEALPASVSGRIDLAYRTSEGWTLVDFKTDRGGVAALPEVRSAEYRSQVDAYASTWARLTGEPVHRCALILTATGEVLGWSPGGGGV